MLLDTVHLDFEWSPSYDSIPNESDFKNSDEYYKELERLAESIINEFTDEELFLFVARANGRSSYVKDGFNSVNRFYHASASLHKPCKKSIISVEVPRIPDLDSEIPYLPIKDNKSDGCYITTAVCKNENKPDDCYELELFRNFRDNWLKKQLYGENLINEYYETAPLIVEQIEKSENPDAVYKMIRNTYLSRCVENLQNKKMDECKNNYIEMVNFLKDMFL